MRRTRLFLVLALALFAALVPISRALAVSWSNYQLGQYYAVEDATDPVIQTAANAVVWFGNATGFVISPDGYILTNYHVYAGWGSAGYVQLEVNRSGYRQRLYIQLVTASAAYDMALYKASGASNLPYIPIKTTAVSPGTDVFIVGHPNGWTQSVTFGRILANNLYIEGRPSVEYSAQTWWGSSGSPVVDRQGRVVALHWGWDSQGTSNGRLTGVPMDQMARAIPLVGQIAGYYTGGSSGSSSGSSSATAPRTTTTTTTSTSGSGSSATITSLPLGSSKTGSLSGTGVVAYYRTDVTSRGNLTVGLSGPSSSSVDFDLSVWKWDAGTQRSNPVGSAEGSTSRETVSIPNASTGTYYVVVWSHTGSGSFTVSATRGGSSTTPPASGSGTAPAPQITGTLRGPRDWALYRVTANVGPLRITINGQSGTDFDLYVYNGTTVSSSSYLGKSDGTSSHESLYFSNAPAGSVVSVLVWSASGSGWFSMTMSGQ